MVGSDFIISQCIKKMIRHSEWVHVLSHLLLGLDQPDLIAAPEELHGWVIGVGVKDVILDRETLVLDHGLQSAVFGIPPPLVHVATDPPENRHFKSDSLRLKRSVCPNEKSDNNYTKPVLVVSKFRLSALVREGALTIDLGNGLDRVVYRFKFIACSQPRLRCISSCDCARSSQPVQCQV